MKKSKSMVYLSPIRSAAMRSALPSEPGKETYQVTKAVNTLSVMVGQMLSEREVSELMRRPGFDVTIQLGRWS